jgi:hypothetical protein
MKSSVCVEIESMFDFSCVASTVCWFRVFSFVPWECQSYKIPFQSVFVNMLVRCFRKLLTISYCEGRTRIQRTFYIMTLGRIHYLQSGGNYVRFNFFRIVVLVIVARTRRSEVGNNKSIHQFGKQLLGRPEWNRNVWQLPDMAVEVALTPLLSQTVTTLTRWLAFITHLVFWLTHDLAFVFILNGIILECS